jgi:hypothetical protein
VNAAMASYGGAGGGGGGGAGTRSSAGTAMGGGQQYVRGGRERIVYDGKRMRAPVVRKTVDYNGSVLKYLRVRLAVSGDFVWVVLMLMVCRRDCTGAAYVATSNHFFNLPLIIFQKYGLAEEIITERFFLPDMLIRLNREVRTSVRLQMATRPSTSQRQSTKLEGQ